MRANSLNSLGIASRATKNVKHVHVFLDYNTLDYSEYTNDIEHTALHS